LSMAYTEFLQITQREPKLTCCRYKKANLHSPHLNNNRRA